MSTSSVKAPYIGIFADANNDAVQIVGCGSSSTIWERVNGSHAFDVSDDGSTLAVGIQNHDTGSVDNVQIFFFNVTASDGESEFHGLELLSTINFTTTNTESKQTAAMVGAVALTEDGGILAIHTLIFDLVSESVIVAVELHDRQEEGYVRRDDWLAVDEFNSSNDLFKNFSPKNFMSMSEDGKVIATWMPRENETFISTYIYTEISGWASTGGAQ